VVLRYSEMLYSQTPRCTTLSCSPSTEPLTTSPYVSHTHFPQSPSSMQRRVPTGQYPYTEGMHMHAAVEPVRMTTSDDDEYDACGDAQEYDEFAARKDKVPSPEQDDTYTTHDHARMPSPARTLTYANPSYKPPQQPQELQLSAMFHTAAEVANGEECTQPKSTPVRATDPFARAWGECSCMHARLGFHARTGWACAREPSGHSFLNQIQAQNATVPEGVGVESIIIFESIGIIHAQALRGKPFQGSRAEMTTVACLMDC
jgi:hypothetical protein